MIIKDIYGNKHTLTKMRLTKYFVAGEYATFSVSKKRFAAAMKKMPKTGRILLDAKIKVVSKYHTKTLPVFFAPAFRKIGCSEFAPRTWNKIIKTFKVKGGKP